MTISPLSEEDEGDNQYEEDEKADHHAGDEGGGGVESTAKSWVNHYAGRGEVVRMGLNMFWEAAVPEGVAVDDVPTFVDVVKILLDELVPVCKLSGVEGEVFPGRQLYHFNQ